ncbi:MAG: NAD(P)H-hydrate epimerase [Candidatus Omnitrophota bacterium]|jgi:NAD(P)H-hydrate epimerase
MRISAEEARRIDQSAIRDYCIPGLLLMENAGRSVSDVISREYKPCKVLVVTGKGNNGGDGLVVARHLANRGYPVQVALLEDPARLKADPLLNFSIVVKMKIPWVLMATASEGKIFEFCRESELVVDAIFGIGVHSPVRGIFERAIRAINRCQRPVVSIDIPSGLDADTGQVHGVAVKAAKTVTLALPKRGLFDGEGRAYAGEIEVADIGIPRELLLPFLDYPCP